MNKNIIRLAGVSAVLGGVYLLVTAVLQAFFDSNLENYPIIWRTIPIMPILLLLGAVGLFVLANGRRGVQVGSALIALGAAVMTVGFALMTWLFNENGWFMMFIGMLILPFGLLVFGLANWRAGILPRWNKAPLIFCVLTTVIIFLSVLQIFQEQQNGYLFGAYLFILAAYFLVIGAAMAQGDGKTAVPNSAVVSLLFLFILLTACAGINTQPKVSFRTPDDGETVSSPLHVVMQAENFTVEEAGDVHDGAGHLHIMVDTPCLDAGEVIPKDDNHRHFGDGSTEADLELPSGAHTLCLQAADGAHVALAGSGMTHQISITVP